MKILKHKNLMGLIFSALLAMPLLGIAARCGYVIANKNAYQSYYGETINDKTEIQTNLVSMNNIDTYYFYNENYIVPTLSQNRTLDLTVTNLNVNEVDYTTNTIRFWARADNTFVAQITGIGNIDLTTTKATMKFVLSGYSGSDTIIDLLNPYFYRYEYNQYSYLDNVFEYSVSQFTSENNLGNVNLFSWFTNMFLSDNAHNNLYVGFANWYMNYAMLVACMHLLFLVLMWFINFARRLLERGMNYDF